MGGGYSTEPCVVSWPPEKYHVTLRFLGELDPADVAVWRDAAATLAARFPVDCTARAVEGFPNGRRARVVAARVDSGGVLEELAEGLDDARREDPRPFRAHVTLGRASRRPVRLSETGSLELPFRLLGVGLYQSLDGRYEHVR